MVKGIKGFSKGYTPWNKGRAGLLSKETIKKMRKASALHGFKKGHPFYPGTTLFEKGKHNNPSGEFKKGQTPWIKGRGSKITPIRLRIWQSSKYQEWRQRVFIRDNFTCQKCRVKGGILNAHHSKKSFLKLLQEVKLNLPLMSLFEGAMIYTPFWDLDNGETLCKRCHYSPTERRKEEVSIVRRKAK